MHNDRNKAREQQPSQEGRRLIPVALIDLLYMVYSFLNSLKWCTEPDPPARKLMLQVIIPGIREIPIPLNLIPQQSLQIRARVEPIALETRYNRWENWKLLHLIILPPFSAWGIGSDSGVESNAPFIAVIIIYIFMYNASHQPRRFSASAGWHC